MSQSWWLASGQIIGNSRARQILRLYSFDGNKLKTIWSRDDLPGGKVTVSKDRRSVVLEYEQDTGTYDRPRTQRVEEEWLLTPDGPTQISTMVE
jgi:hypothetical protein